MKKILMAFVALLLTSTPVLAADKPVVKIGASLPLTGDNAQWGIGVRNALLLAQENLPKNTRFSYELVFEDDGLEAKRAAAAANKLISIDKVDALVSVSSGTGGVISPIAEQNKVIHFGIASAQDVANGDYNFIHWTTPAEEARVMAAELQKRKIKNVALIGLNQQGVLAVRAELKKSLEENKIKLVADEVVNPGEKDFRSLIAKVKPANPDIYMIMFFTPELEIVTKQLREAGVATPLTSIEVFSMSNQPELFEGQWYVDAADASQNFYDQYQSHFKKIPFIGAPNGYDIFNLIVYGYEHTPSTGKPTTTEVIKTLYQVKDFDAATGKLSIDSKGVVFSPATVKVIKNGKPVVLKETAP